MLRIRRMKTADFQSVIKLTDQEHWGYGIRDIERIRALEPRGCLVASLNGRMIGLTTTITYGKRLGWIGNVVVQRKYRGSGIGSTLVQSAMGHLLCSHVKSIGLYSFPENKPMYERLGFRTEGGFVRLAMSRRTRTLVRQDRAPLRQILGLDRRVFGADRTRLLRHLFKEFPKGWAWTMKRSKLTGFSVVKRYKDSSEIGPAICENQGPDEIADLLESSVALVTKWPLEVSVPEINRAVLKVADRLGFRAERRGVVMSLADLDRIGTNPAIVALGFLDKG